MKINEKLKSYVKSSKTNHYYNLKRSNFFKSLIASQTDKEVVQKYLKCIVWLDVYMKSHYLYINKLYENLDKASDADMLLEEFDELIDNVYEEGVIEHNNPTKLELEAINLLGIKAMELANDTIKSVESMTKYLENIHLKLEVIKAHTILKANHHNFDKIRMEGLTKIALKTLGVPKWVYLSKEIKDLIEKEAQYDKIYLNINNYLSIMPKLFGDATFKNYYVLHKYYSERKKQNEKDCIKLTQNLIINDFQFTLQEITNNKKEYPLL